ncbi:MAG: MFS transporter [Nitriliruptorales bacterium]|nr:MFS transporter [Nitriliruptorales bacterium]
MARRPDLLRDPTFVVTLVIAVVVALGFGLVVPVLPLFVRAFDVGLFAVTGVVAAFAGVRLLSSIYTGALADRIGSRRAVGWGAIIVAVSSLGVALAPNYWTVLVVRGIGGFGSALFFNALLTQVVRIVPADQRGRAVGALQGAFLFGIAFGPSVGGLLAEPLGLRWPFAIYAIFCGAAGIVALRFLGGGVGAEVDADLRLESDAATEGGPTAGKPQGLAATLRLTREFCRDRAFVAALVMMGASRWAATGVRFSLIPVFGAEVVGASELLVGSALTLAAVTHLLVLWPTGRIADTVGRKALGAPAYVVFGAIAMMLTFATSVPSFLVVMALYGVGTGMTSVTPPAIVADVVPHERTGVGVGVLNTAGDLGSVAGPLVSGWLAGQFGYSWGFGASAMLLAAGGLVALTMRETLPARTAPVAGTAP